jgi:hypothetical protein
LWQIYSVAVEYVETACFKPAQPASLHENGFRAFAAAKNTLPLQSEFKRF